MSEAHMPTILVIFGATGDLARRKLVPALLHLAQKKKLPEKFCVVGFSRKDISDEAFRAYVREIVAEHHTFSSGEEEAFLRRFVFVRGDLSHSGDYRRLQDRLSVIDREWGMCANKLFYLAVPPELYKGIFAELKASKLTAPCSPEEGWTRIIVEKPFGHDAKTARALDLLLGTQFKEEQIYRIDHYLAKEMLQNIIAFRFSNNLMEHGWGKETVERIDIRLWESIGVEKRGAFYDAVGALRDVGQNHLLQMLALVTMERPHSFSAEDIRSAREAALGTLAPLSTEEIRTQTHRAQYEGFRSISGVRADSETETYFRVPARLTGPRWEGVPIMMESGKRMGMAHKEIVVHFRHEQPCLCPPGVHYQNKVVFSLEPEERITIHFWAKKPGLSAEMEERRIEFLLREGAKRHQYVEEYEKLLLDCIVGDQTLFVSTHEVKAMWQYIDPIVAAWSRQQVPLAAYVPDTHTFALEHEAVSRPFVKKSIGYVGLGKMGKGMTRRLIERGWEVALHDVHPDAFSSDDADLLSRRVESLAYMVATLSRPRVVWLMIPAGKPIDAVVFGKGGLAEILTKGDIIIDGGNSLYKDTILRAKKLAKRGIHYVDVGVSGGPSGARFGASLMVGADPKVYELLRPLFTDLALPGGYMRVGPSGAGHFVKMVHNGIEYGMMQSIAEGFAVMKKSPLKLSLTDIASIYNHGSVIESRLIGWLGEAYRAHGEDLKDISGSVGHTGEGKWTVETAKKLNIPVAAIRSAFAFRIASQKKPSYTGRILTALRNQFGGHSTKK